MYLIIGASSFIGSHLYDYCTAHEIAVLGTYYSHSYHKEWIPFDICTDDLCRVVCEHKISKRIRAVIICSANTSIDDCKKNEKASNDINVRGIKRVIEQANELGMKSVFLSSEAVFDGGCGMYTEEDRPNPVTLYGKQKLQIEQFLMNRGGEYLIFRISRAIGSMYGEKDIFDEFYRKIIHGDEIVCLKNQSFCITEINDIVQAIVKALERGLNGLYHLSSDNYITRYALARLYIEKIFGQYEKVVEKEYMDMSFLDERHICGGLNGERLAEALDIHYMGIGEILDRYRDTYEREQAVKGCGE